MTNFPFIVLALLVLGILLLVHELGHFLSARALGLPVEEFAIGFGPKAAGWVSKKTGTRFSIRILPVGGYVRFYGEDQDLDDPRAFNKQPVWKRIISVLAGAGMNFLLAFVLAVVVMSTFGIAKSSNLIASIDTGAPAGIAGMLPGDRITAIDELEVSDPQELINKISSLNEETNITVLREGREIVLTMTPFFDEELGRYRIGIGLGYDMVKVPLGESFSRSFSYNAGVIKDMLGMLKNMVFSGEGAGDIMGPLGTISVISEQAKSGLESVLGLMILISLNLGIVNLLPLPALDGGRFVFLVIEAVQGKPIDQNKEGTVHFVGLMALFALMILVTYKDVVRMFFSGS